MSLMPPTDSMFLVAESREQPMHVGGLQVFELPAGADPDWLRDLYAQALAQHDVDPLFLRRPYRALSTAGQWGWRTETDIDLEHHVRHSALPRPGRVRELLALVSRLHQSLLDRHRPLWEAYLIEGLEGDRFAVYTKMHHSLLDGVSALRLLQRSLSPDPTAAVPMPYAARPRPPKPEGPSLLTELLGLPLAVPRVAYGAAKDVLGLTPALVRLVEGALREQAVALPLRAPRTLLNVPITGSRRFAAQEWPLDRVRAVGQAAGATINDVVLAMCAGALRAYLLEQDALPAAPLIAMTPVSLRGDDGDEANNATGAVLCNLATHLQDAGERLAAVRASMRSSKAVLAGLNQAQAIAVGAVVLSPVLLTTVLRQAAAVTPPPYNLVISNVPGPRDPLYWNGARMQGLYPMSIPTNGQALNITLTSYAGGLQFGLIGCRRSVPHLQRMLGHLEDSLAELERAVA